MEEFENLAAAMCQQISVHASQAQQFYNLADISDNVLDVMRQIPRHEFVQYNSIEEAYFDKPLRIGHEQTISQPYIVALMTSLIQPKSTDKILDIGTGSGYQAAILAKLVDIVYTVEIIPDLAQLAMQRFENLHINNIVCANTNGLHGWLEHAPFDGIIVAAAAKEIPVALIQQLKPDRKMVIPLEDQFGDQQLFLIEKHQDLSVTKQALLPVRFVTFQTT